MLCLHVVWKVILPSTRLDCGTYREPDGNIGGQLDGVDELATVYEKLTLLAHVDFVKSICLLVAAPCF